MEWNLMNPIGFLEGDIGFVVNGVFILSDDCEDVLIEILDLVANDGSDGSVRKQIMQQNLITKDLYPLLMAVEDDSPLYDYAIKLLSLLTQPLDLLTGPHPQGSPEDKRQAAVTGLLQQADEVCWSKQFLVKAIKNELTLRLERAKDGSMNPRDCETINYALLLLRNLFYYGERDRQTEMFGAHQRMIFETRIDEILLQILRYPQKILFTVSIVQILSYLFRDHEKYLYKSYPARSSPLLTPLSPDLANLSLGTDLVLVSEQPGIIQEDSLLRRQFINSIMDSMELRKPQVDAEGEREREERGDFPFKDERSSNVSDAEVIGQHLENFLQHFLAENYTSFIADLLKITLSSNGKIFDNSYLIWSLSFFPRFVDTNNYDVSNLIPCIDVNMISYLVYVMVECTEKLLSLQKQKKSCEQTSQKLHLTVLSLLNLFRLILMVLEAEEMKKHVSLILQEALAKMSQLRDVFLLLLRHHQCNKHGMAFLRDVIITNHYLLLLLERWVGEKVTTDNFSMLDHIKKFATVEIMGKFGHALENYDCNPRCLNDSILTMMHHVAGDCNQPRSLMQLPIMKTFTEIWDQKHLLSQEFNDLIEFVLGQFMALAEENPMLSAHMLFGTDEKLMAMEESPKPEEMVSHWSSEEREILMSSILNLQESDNIASDLRNALQQFGIQRTEVEIESFIQEMGWLPSDMNIIVDDLPGKEVSEEESRKQQIVEELSQVPQEELQEYLVSRLAETDQEHLTWLQDCLLQAAEAKFCFLHNMFEKITEPVWKMCALLKKDFPVIIVSEEQEKVIHNIYFFALLNELGLKSHVGCETQDFWRIPFEWTSTDLFEKAKLLGPLSCEVMKFDQEEDLAYMFATSTFISKEEDFEGSSELPRNVKIPDSEWMACVQEVNKLQTWKVSPSMDVN